MTYTWIQTVLASKVYNLTKICVKHQQIKRKKTVEKWINFSPNKYVKKIRSKSIFLMRTQKEMQVENVNLVFLIQSPL